MNKIKTLKSLVLILAVINIVLIASIFFRKRPPHRLNEKKAESVIQKRFSFDDNQMNAFKESKNKHKEKSKELESSLEKISAEFYTSSSIVNEHLLDSILIITEDIYKLNDTHFDEIRSICKKDQLPEVEEFIIQHISRRSIPKHKNRKKKK